MNFFFTGAAPYQRTTGEWVLYGVGLLATVVVTVFITRIARKALAKKISACLGEVSKTCLTKVVLALN